MKSVRRGVLLACVITVVAVLGSLASPAGAAVSRASQPKAAPKTCPRASYGAHYYAPGNGKTVALTFDDGPGKSTPAILAILARYKVPATFFNIGRQVAGRPTSVRQEVKAGYAMGDHTWDHANLLLLSASSQAREIGRMNSALRSVANVNACAFRPPYGNYNATTLRLAQQRRMSVWLWSVDTEDWKAEGSSSSYWVNRITRLAEREGGAQRHPVVLMHNQAAGNPATVAALPAIIRYFKAHGYRFVAL
jgi:peptidoglycan/xylan/chitin deacetylase (PgdA/CDA1 family)